MNTPATKLAQSPLFLVEAFDGLPLAVIVSAADGKIVLANTQAEQMFGYDREELFGCPIEQLVPQRFRHHHPELRAGFSVVPTVRAMGPGRDLFALRKDGSEFPVEIGLKPLTTDGIPLVISAILDITERKQREKSLREALKEKEVLLGEVHHRVKNNLQVIHSLLDLQAMNNDDPNVAEILRGSQNRVRTISLIHQTLYQSQDIAKVDFNNFLNTLVPFLMESYAVRAMGVRHVIDASDIHLPVGTAIPCALLVNELVSNAFKHAFSADREGTIWVELKGVDAGDISLSVANDGVPLPEDFHARGASTLGLKLVSLLTEQLHGRLEVRRADPTRFTIHFRIQ